MPKVQCPHCSAVDEMPSYYLGSLNVECSRCQQRFPALSKHEVRPSEPITSSSTHTSVGEASDALVLVSILGPIFAAILLFFWVTPMDLILQAPHSKFTLITILTVCGTATLIGIDADRLGLGKNGNGGMNPILAGILALLLWPIFYPVYFFQRSKYTQRNYAYFGLLAAILFTGASAYVFDSIYQRTTEMNRQLRELEKTIKDIENF